MEFVLSSAINATAEIAAADAYPHIRVVDGPQQNSCAQHVHDLDTRLGQP